MEKKIKICYVASVDITLKFILLSHMKFLKEQGYDVYAVCSKGEWVEYIEKEGIKIKTIRFKRKIFSPISDLAAFVRLFFYFKKEKFHIVHTQTLKPEFYGQIAAKLAGVPIIANTSFGFDFADDAHYREKIFFILIEKIAAKFSTVIFSYNKKNIGILEKEGICKNEIIKFLSCGVDLEKFNPQRFSKEFIFEKKKQLGIDPSKKVIGIVARLVEAKGYLDLFAALKIVLKKFPDTMLLAVGPLEPEKKDGINPVVASSYGIQDNILFLGERADINQIYPLMNVFVLPSHRENMGYSILEASAMELPVISANVGGCPEAVDDGKTGILIPPKSPGDLAEAIIYLLSHPEMAQAMGREGRKKILAEFDEKLFLSRLQAEYSKLIEKKINLKYKVCCVVSVDMTLKFMLFNQLKFLQGQGYDVFAICSPGKWVEDIRKQGIKVKTIPIKRNISPITDLFLFFRMYFYFRKEKFDIVHTHTAKPEIYGQIAAKLAGIPIIVDTLHGFDFPAGVSAFSGKIFFFLQKIAGKCSSCIFSISNAIINITLKRNIYRPGLLKYLGRDIDTERFNPNKFSQDFIIQKKKELGIPLNKKIIGIVARLVAEKGYLDLFEAFKKVVLKFPQTILLVIGQEEPERGDAIRMNIVKKYGIENNVIFLGERSDVDEIYPLMDVFVLPSHREGLGASLLEASAMEKPVITIDVGGCPEAVSDGKTGILVPLKNVEKLSQAIVYLLNNPEKAKEMGRRGREKILREFNEKLIFNRLKEEYQRLIKEKLK